MREDRRDCFWKGKRSGGVSGEGRDEISDSSDSVGWRARNAQLAQAGKSPGIYGMHGGRSVGPSVVKEVFCVFTPGFQVINDSCSSY